MTTIAQERWSKRRPQALRTLLALTLRSQKASYMILSFKLALLIKPELRYTTAEFKFYSNLC